MGRSGGRRSAPAPRRAATTTTQDRSHSSSSSRTPATTQPHQTPATHAPGAGAHPPAAAAPQQGGFLRNVAELGAGIAVGHVAGRALENVFFGGRHAAPEEVKAAETEAKSGPCAGQYRGFLRCLEKNDDSIEECDWAYDMFKECQISRRGDGVQFSHPEPSSSWNSKEQSSSY
eukprot:TRINITY_DN337_c0_g1_i1.p1 TRINITY_DN337_c0_g1~~TRINITY_DN337_c0_g1_i1.p1  ORF type:complete len:189 (-),score=20.26 TRINITY_DN337_c0_g1_i1:98-619(-)